jgi:hypothetical protein
MLELREPRARHTPGCKAERKERARPQRNLRRGREVILAGTVEPVSHRVKLTEKTADSARWCGLAALLESQLSRFEESSQSQP